MRAPTGGRWSQLRRLGSSLSQLTVIACLLLLSTGCESLSTYGRSRMADFKDFIPWSISCGWGIGITARATPMVNVGLALTPIKSLRWGYDDRVVHGVWREAQTVFPYTIWIDYWDPDPAHPDTTGFNPWVLPIVHRWQVFRDAPSGEGNRQQTYEPRMKEWGRHPSVVRESLGAFIVPAERRWVDFVDLRREQGNPDVIDILGSPDRATQWESRRTGRPASNAWDLFELDVFAGIVGVRLGVRPVEFADFVLGIFTIDFMGDDLPQPEEFVPREEPLPAAS
jgi:hypothetical protein